MESLAKLEQILADNGLTEVLRMLGELCYEQADRENEPDSTSWKYHGQMLRTVMAQITAPPSSYAVGEYTPSFAMRLHSRAEAPQE